MKTSTPKAKIVVYDRDTAEVLREATKAERNLHYAADGRDEPPLDGKDFGYPGQHVWVDIEDPSTSIAGWTPCGLPIFRDWPYTGTEVRRGKERTVKCTADEALRFAHEPSTAKDKHGRVDGDAYGAKGARVVVHFAVDWGLPPQPIIDAWRARYFTTKAA